MFRPMRRFRQEMTREACEEVLCRMPSGVLSLLGEDGYPYGVPINHYYCPEDGKLYFYCGKTKIEVIEHFADNGKALNTLVEDVITYTAHKDVKSSRMN